MKTYTEVNPMNFHLQKSHSQPYLYLWVDNSIMYLHLHEFESSEVVHGRHSYCKDDIESDVVYQPLLYLLQLLLPLLHRLQKHHLVQSNPIKSSHYISNAYILNTNMCKMRKKRQLITNPKATEKAFPESDRSSVLFYL